MNKQENGVCDQPYRLVKFFDVLEEDNMNTSILEKTGKKTMKQRECSAHSGLLESICGQNPMRNPAREMFSCKEKPLLLPVRCHR